MKKILVPVSLLLLLTGLSFSSRSQQYVIADKDNTHPGSDLLAARRAIITGFHVQEENNCNDIFWTAAGEEETRKYIIEYSVNGTDYQSAGEKLVSNQPYTLRHYFNFEHPLLYRVRTEQMNGRQFYSAPVLIGGTSISPVEIYPTIISGNVVNLNAALPVENITILTGNGADVFNKAIGGKTDFISVAIPALPRGVYFMVFYGKGWKKTGRFIVQ